MDGILLLPSGDRLFTNGRDGTVRVWNAQNMLHMKTLRVRLVGHEHLPLCQIELRGSVVDRPQSRTTTARDLVGQLTGLETSPLRRILNEQLDEMLIIGDDCGHISLYRAPPRGLSLSCLVRTTRAYPKRS